MYFLSRFFLGGTYWDKRLRGRRDLLVCIDCPLSSQFTGLERTVGEPITAASPWKELDFFSFLLLLLPTFRLELNWTFFRTQTGVFGVCMPWGWWWGAKTQPFGETTDWSEWNDPRNKVGEYIHLLMWLDIYFLCVWWIYYLFSQQLSSK